MNLNFYKRPFKSIIESGRVYDVDDNFMFQFEMDDIQLQKDIINHLNNDNESRFNRFRRHPEDPIVVQIQSDSGKWCDIIMIRGWGNLTGSGAHNFKQEKAIKIQDNLVDWLLQKLNK